MELEGWIPPLKMDEALAEAVLLTGDSGLRCWRIEPSQSLNRGLQQRHLMQVALSRVAMR